MIMEIKAVKLRTRRAQRASWGLAILGVVVLGGCSEIPNALNPVEWYKDTVEFFSEDEQAGGEKGGLAADKNAPPPGAGKPFPNLASVPARPQPTPADQRRSAVEGLVADVEQRRYSSETFTRQGEPASTLGTMANAPPAVPSFPVAQAPLTPAPVAQAPVAQAPAWPASLSRSPPPPPIAVLPGGVEKAYRAGLAQRLPRGGSDQPAAGGLPANAQAAIIDEPFSTVVISSAGVELLNPVAAPAARPLAGLARPASRAGMAPRASGVSLPSGARMVATIQYGNGSSSLNARDRYILRNVSALQRRGGGRVTVIGHASQRTRNMGTDRRKRVNQKISQDRADAVSRELIRLGVAAENIQVSAMSDSRPLFYEFMPTGEAGNRRTEIYIGG